MNIGATTLRTLRALLANARVVVFLLLLAMGSAEAATSPGSANRLPAGSGLTIQTRELPPPILGKTYTQRIIVRGGLPPYTLSISALDLPAGLKIDASSGTISGITRLAGSVAFTISAIDSAGNLATQSYSFLIAAPIDIQTNVLVGAVVGLALHQPIETVGGAGHVTCSLGAGDLPTGLNIDPSPCVISGTPRIAGPYDFTLKFSDENASIAVRRYRGSIAKPGTLAITTSGLSPLMLGARYEQHLSAGGGVGHITFSIGAGALPRGLSLDARSGIISGIPRDAGEDFVTVLAADGHGTPAVQSFLIRVLPKLKMMSEALPTPRIGIEYLEAVEVVAGNGTYNCRISAGSLPPEMSLSPQTCWISGTAAKPGRYRFAVEVRDGLGATSSQAFSWVIPDRE
jgi:large repetitive protein